MNTELDYMIQENPTNGTIEITFGDVPPEAVRDTISGMGMRYNSARRVWAGYNISEADLREAVEDAVAGRKGRFAPGDWTDYEIRRNEELGSTEVRFRGRPPEVIREALRGIGMRYHKLKCFWYSSYVTEDKVQTAIERAKQYA